MGLVAQSILMSATDALGHQDVHCTLGWRDFSFLWNFEKKQVVVVTFGKKHVFIKKLF